jgi:hypothetical protein
MPSSGLTICVSLRTDIGAAKKGNYRTTEVSVPAGTIFAISLWARSRRPQAVVIDHGE